MYFYSIICGGLIGLIAFVIYLWHKSVQSETKRLYKWQDDMFDRINSETIEQYAMIRRIKYDMTLKSLNVPQTKGKPDIVEEGREPAFIHQKR